MKITNYIKQEIGNLCHFSGVIVTAINGITNRLFCTGNELKGKTV